MLLSLGFVDSPKDRTHNEQGCLTAPNVHFALHLDTSPHLSNFHPKALVIWPLPASLARHLTLHTTVSLDDFNSQMRLGLS